MTMIPTGGRGSFWLDPTEAIERHVERGRRRLAAALRAQADGSTIYLDADRELIASMPAGTPDALPQK
jgi:hypothetical protein